MTLLDNAALCVSCIRYMTISLHVSVCKHYHCLLCVNDMVTLHICFVFFTVNDFFDC